MRVLVTGATGFVGRYAVAELLEAGHEVAAITRSPARAGFAGLRAIKGDLGRPEALRAPIRRFGPQAFLHLAWSAIPDFSPAACRRNLDDSLSFVDLMAAEKGCRKWLIGGTCAEYGASTGRCVETGRVEPKSQLGWSKRAIHGYASLRAAESGAELFWFRLFFVYGPGQRAGSLIPSMAAAFRSGAGPSLRTPDAANDFVHVRDVARGFRAALESGSRPGVYNLAGGRAVSVRSICRRIERELTGGEAFTRGLPAPRKGAGVGGFWGDVSAARKGVGWIPRVALDDGLRDYLMAPGTAVK